MQELTHVNELELSLADTSLQPLHHMHAGAGLFREGSSHALSAREHLERVQVSSGFAFRIIARFHRAVTTIDGVPGAIDQGLLTGQGPLLVPESIRADALSVTLYFKPLLNRSANDIVVFGLTAANRLRQSPVACVSFAAFFGWGLFVLFGLSRFRLPLGLIFFRLT